MEKPSLQHIFGAPRGCAMALAQIQQLHALKLIRTSARRGEDLLEALLGVRIRRSSRLPCVGWD